jgi:hypothetical protein
MRLFQASMFVGVLGASLIAGCKKPIEEALVLFQVEVDAQVPAFEKLVFSVSSPSGIPNRSVVGEAGHRSFRFGYYMPEISGTVSIHGSALDSGGCTIGEGTLTVNGVMAGRTTDGGTMTVAKIGGCNGDASTQVDAPPADGMPEDRDASGGDSCVAGTLRCPCLAGMTCDGGLVCEQGQCAPGPPRLIAPLSTATVTSRQPILHWVLAGGSDGAHVQICRDRACRSPVVAFDAIGSIGAPAADLPVGMLFWRAYSQSGGVTGTTATPTWQFSVGARTAPVNTSWGTTVDVNGDGYADVIVGAFDAINCTGRAYVYEGSPSSFATQPSTTITGPDGADGAFAYSVASAGDVNGDGYGDVIIGALHGAPGQSAGAAYVYLGDPLGLTLQPSFAIAPPANDDLSFGGSAASAGDVNGDGYADVIVGASGSMNNTGRAYVYLGSASGIVSQPSFTLTGPDGVNGSFGRSVASTGDVDGDGYADVIVGAPGASGTGKAYIYRGGATGLPTQPSLTLNGPGDLNGSFGSSVASAGDINGDGYADVIVAHIGIAYVYAGSTSGLPTQPSVSISAPDGGAFGSPVASAGDINRDGYADVIIGAPSVLNLTGRVYVYNGGALGLSSPIVFTGPDGQGGVFGASSASAGDVDADGYGDFVIGAYGFTNHTGRAYVYISKAFPIVSNSVPTVLTGPDGTYAEFGTSVASALESNVTGGAGRGTGS